MYKSLNVLLLCGSHAPISEFWLDNVQCYGDETSLSQCRHLPWGYNDCERREAAGVFCAPRPRTTAQPGATTAATTRRDPATTTTTTTTPDPFPYVKIVNLPASNIHEEPVRDSARDRTSAEAVAAASHYGAETSTVTAPTQAGQGGGGGIWINRPVATARTVVPPPQSPIAINDTSPKQANPPARPINDISPNHIYFRPNPNENNNNNNSNYQGETVIDHTVPPTDAPPARAHEQPVIGGNSGLHPDHHDHHSHPHHQHPHPGQLPEQVLAPTQTPNHNGGHINNLEDIPMNDVAVANAMQTMEDHNDVRPGTNDVGRPIKYDIHNVPVSRGRCAK